MVVNRFLNYDPFDWFKKFKHILNMFAEGTMISYNNIWKINQNCLYSVFISQEYEMVCNNIILNSLYSIIMWEHFM